MHLGYASRRIEKKQKEQPRGSSRHSATLSTRVLPDQPALSSRPDVPPAGAERSDGARGFPTALDPLHSVMVPILIQTVDLLNALSKKIQLPDAHSKIPLFRTVHRP